VLSNSPEHEYTYCVFLENEDFNISNLANQIIVRNCFKPLLNNFCALYSKSKKRSFNVFVLGGSPGMGKSVFGVLLILFIANAISISYSGDKEIDKNKYSNFFPELLLKNPEKGFVILYQIQKPAQSYFIVQFSLEHKTWKCIEVGINAKFSKLSRKFSKYQCFFISDSVIFQLSEINLSFDGIIITIGSPKSVVSINELNKYNEPNFSYYYYPLWEDSEFKNFIHHFNLENLFDSSEERVLQMGLQDLKKTEAFGNNPRILKSSEIKNILKGLSETMRSGNLDRYINNLTSISDVESKNINEVIHRIFHMRATDDYESFSPVLASGYLLCFITRYLDNIHIGKSSSLYFDNTNPVLKGIYFENFFHTYIMKTKKNCVIDLKHKYVLVGKKFQLNTFSERRCTFDVSKYVRTDEIIYSELKSDEYYCPRVFNFSTFDSVFRGTIKETSGNKNAVFFFQCTIQDHHEIKRKNYSTIKDSLKLGTNKCVFRIFSNVKLNLFFYINYFIKKIIIINQH
jgi:hypothetical protein